MNGAFLRRRDRTVRSLRVEHYSSAVNKSDRRRRRWWPAVAAGIAAPAALLLGLLVEQQYQVIPLHDPDTVLKEVVDGAHALNGSSTPPFALGIPVVAGRCRRARSARDAADNDFLSPP